MSYLLFLDESGHDHKNMPYEIHGGIALHTGSVWPFVQGMRALEQEAFGTTLHDYQAELKGAHLLDKKRYQWAAQEADPLPDVVRRQQAQAFLAKGRAKQPPTRSEFTAYGQACIKMAKSALDLLQRQEACLFAVALPKGAHKPPPSHQPENLRRDWVYLIDRYSLFLQEKQAHGLLVLDHIEHSEDRRFMQRIERYFSLTQNGREYARRIVPTPLFVMSDMTSAIQAADICIILSQLGISSTGTRHGRGHAPGDRVRLRGGFEPTAMEGYGGERRAKLPPLQHLLCPAALCRGCQKKRRQRPVIHFHGTQSRASVPIMAQNVRIVYPDQE